MNIDFRELFLNRNIAVFFIKLTFIYLLISLLIIQIDTKISKSDGKAISLYLKGAISNPTALWKSSEQYEEAKQFKKAIIDMELAIGLLEIYQVNREVTDKYTTRLDYLRAKSAQ